MMKIRDYWIYKDQKTGVLTLVSGSNISESDKNYEQITKFKAAGSRTFFPPHQTFISEPAVRNESYRNKFGELVENFIPYTKYIPDENGDFVHIGGEYINVSEINGYESD